MAWCWSAWRMKCASIPSPSPASAAARCSRRPPHSEPETCLLPCPSPPNTLLRSTVPTSPPQPETAPQFCTQQILHNWSQPRSFYSLRGLLSSSSRTEPGTTLTSPAESCTSRQRILGLGRKHWTALWEGVWNLPIATLRWLPFRGWGLGLVCSLCVLSVSNNAWPCRPPDRSSSIGGRRWRRTSGNTSLWLLWSWNTWPFRINKISRIHPLLAGLKIDEGIRKFARYLTNIKNKNKMHGGTFFYFSILPVEQQSGKRRREAASSNDQSKNEN